MITLRPALPGSDFKRVIELATFAYGQFTTEADIQHVIDTKPYFYHLMVTEDERGQVVGYFDIEGVPDLAAGIFHLGLVVAPDQRGKGIGSIMFNDALTVCAANGCHVLKTSTRENCPEGMRFLESRRFEVKGKSFESLLDLSAFDETPFADAIEKVQAQGIRFANMAELGNTEDARRKLYVLNNTCAMEIPGSDGQPAWKTFEAFDETVCNQTWYRPAGQIVAIDAASDEFIGIVAIAKEEPNTYAYNLHTGVNKRYRGRGIATALKLLGIRYASAKGATHMRTHNNDVNAPMLALNMKLGYVPLTGVFRYERQFDTTQDHA